jgi:hypothetical protein
MSNARDYIIFIYYSKFDMASKIIIRFWINITEFWLNDDFKIYVNFERIKK